MFTDVITSGQMLWNMFLCRSTPNLSLQNGASLPDSCKVRACSNLLPDHSLWHSQTVWVVGMGHKKQEQNTGTCRNMKLKARRTWRKVGGIRLSNRGFLAGGIVTDCNGVHRRSVGSLPHILCADVRVPVPMVPLPCPVSVPNMFSRSICTASDHASYRSSTPNACVISLHCCSEEQWAEARWYLSNNYDIL